MSTTSGRLIGTAGVIVAITVGLAACIMIARGHHRADPAADISDDPEPRVQVITASPAPPALPLSLPGVIRAWHSAPIYAQVSGYVRMWYKDYGAPVRAGDVLASIDAPGLDQQFATAQETLDAAADRYRLAAMTAKRWQALAGTQAVSRQEVDVQTATAASEAALVEAARHEVARFQALEHFKTVVAPFDGVVTERDTDVGAYVNGAGGAANAHDGSRALFSVSDIHKLRVFVSVPQDDSAMLKPGLTATLTLPQFPGRRFTATLATTANAFDPVTRTVIVELVVDNPDHLIWPGGYADTRFTVPDNPNILIVPQQSLLSGAAGVQAAIVGPGDHVHLQTVQVGDDLGNHVEVTGGLTPQDRVIDNPSAGFFEGEKVRVVPVAPSEAGPT